MVQTAAVSQHITGVSDADQLAASGCGGLCMKQLIHAYMGIATLNGGPRQLSAKAFVFQKCIFTCAMYLQMRR